LISSNNQTVKFEVKISGIFCTDTIVKGTKYSRLILQGGSAINPAGSPELPVLSYKFAAPKCNGKKVVSSVISKQDMKSCLVYPVPEIVYEENSEGIVTAIEQFTFNAGAYSQIRSNEPVSIIYSEGAIRAQNYIEIVVQPVEYCPVNERFL
jgi:transcription elongation factor Elf1